MEVLKIGRGEETIFINRKKMLATFQGHFTLYGIYKHLIPLLF